jgi:predicted ABC-class ATPase
MRCIPDGGWALVPLAAGITHISGGGGWGKTSVLQALRLALGDDVFGRKHEWCGMGRVPRYIRAGSGSGPMVAEVDVANAGPGAYRPDVYGTTVG